MLQAKRTITCVRIALHAVLLTLNHARQQGIFQTSDGKEETIHKYLLLAGI